MGIIVRSKLFIYLIRWDLLHQVCQVSSEISLALDLSRMLARSRNWPNILHQLFKFWVTGRPGILVGNNGSEIKALANNIKKFIPNNRQIIINIIEVENVNSNASLIADLVVQQLEDRVAFRRAIREALKCAQDNEVNGIKIQVSGRLNGAEIARSEWIREGRVPLQTLRADIDYSVKEANTIYGVLGIKVWLFKNEILTK